MLREDNQIPLCTTLFYAALSLLTYISASMNPSHFH